jgi:hypothetical protein
MEDELRESARSLAEAATAENLARVEGQAAHLRAQVAELAPEDDA